MVHVNKDWMPVLNGETYCSPACGFGCTKGSYEAAARTAQFVANELGEGWEPRVFENSGWQWEVVSGAVEIHARPGNGFAAVIQSEPATFSARTRHGLRFEGQGTTPGRALAEAKRHAIGAATAISEAVHGAPSRSE